jgi:hypothetical protein
MDGRDASAWGGLDLTEFDNAAPFRAAPGLKAALACAGLACLAIGALIGIYFGVNSVSLL